MLISLAKLRMLAIWLAIFAVLDLGAILVLTRLPKEHYASFRSIGWIPATLATLMLPALAAALWEIRNLYCQAAFHRDAADALAVQLTAACIAIATLQNQVKHGNPPDALATAQRKPSLPRLPAGKAPALLPLVLVGLLMLSSPARGATRVEFWRDETGSISAEIERAAGEALSREVPRLLTAIKPSHIAVYGFGFAPAFAVSVIGESLTQVQVACETPQGILKSAKELAQEECQRKRTVAETDYSSRLASVGKRLQEYLLGPQRTGSHPCSDVHGLLQRLADYPADGPTVFVQSDLAHSCGKAPFSLPDMKVKVYIVLLQPKRMTGTYREYLERKRAELQGPGIRVLAPYELPFFNP